MHAAHGYAARCKLAAAADCLYMHSFGVSEFAIVIELVDRTELVAEAVQCIIQTGPNDICAFTAAYIALGDSLLTSRCN